MRNAKGLRPIGRVEEGGEDGVSIRPKDGGILGGRHRPPRQTKMGLYRSRKSKRLLSILRKLLSRALVVAVRSKVLAKFWRLWLRPNSAALTCTERCASKRNNASCVRA